LIGCAPWWWFFDRLCAVVVGSLIGGVPWGKVLRSLFAVWRCAWCTHIGECVVIRVESAVDGISKAVVLLQF
jgi:hypothetical protein